MQNPFLNNPSGSKWGSKQLQWLKVKSDDDVPVSELVQSIPDSSELHLRFHARFGPRTERTWFQKTLQDLEYGQTSEPDFQPSSPFTPVTTTTSSTMKRPHPHSETSSPTCYNAKRLRSGAKSLEATPRTPKARRTQIVGGTWPYEVLSAPPKLCLGALSPDTPKFATRSCQSLSLCLTSPCTARGHSQIFSKQCYDLDTTDTQSSYVPSSSPPIPLSPSSPRVGKPYPEAFVEQVVGNFFWELITAVKDVLPLEIKLVFRPKLTVTIDGASISSTPDMVLRVSYEESLHEIPVEIKADPNAECWGQVASIMFGMGTKRIQENKPLITVLMITWLRDRAYISRADIRNTYLSRCMADSQNLPCDVLIKHSQMFDLRNTEHCIDFCVAIIGAILTTMSRLSRGLEFVEEWLSNQGSEAE